MKKERKFVLSLKKIIFGFVRLEGLEFEFHDTSDGGASDGGSDARVVAAGAISKYLVLLTIVLIAVLILPLGGVDILQVAAALLEIRRLLP